MLRFSYVALFIALSAAVVFLCSCAGGGVVDPTDPIIPSPEIKEGVVDPLSRAITITKAGLTVTVEHWSRTRLNRKYTTVDMRSPFYYLETWEQSFQNEAFHVTIKNDTPRNVIVVFKDCTLEDEREYTYRPITSMEDFRYKFVMKKLMDLRTKRGMEIAPQIILSEVLGESDTVPPGQTVSGFIPFNTPSTQAAKVWLTLVLEKEPEAATASYQKVTFRFDYIQDLVLFVRQPAIKR